MCRLRRRRDAAWRGLRVSVCVCVFVCASPEMASGEKLRLSPVAVTAHTQTRRKSAPAATVHKRSVCVCVRVYRIDLALLQRRTTPGFVTRARTHNAAAAAAVIQIKYHRNLSCACLPTSLEWTIEKQRTTFAKAIIVTMVLWMDMGFGVKSGQYCLWRGVVC